MALNWTTILTGTIPAVINALAIFLATRYAGPYPEPYREQV